jgi:hypothetical protein
MRSVSRRRLQPRRKKSAKIWKLWRRLGRSSNVGRKEALSVERRERSRRRKRPAKILAKRQRSQHPKRRKLSQYRPGRSDHSPPRNAHRRLRLIH